MFKRLTATQIYLGISILLLAIAISLHYLTDDSIDIAIHDFYIVTCKFDFLIVYALLFLVFTLISWGFDALKRPLSKILSYTVFILILPGILIIIGEGFFATDPQGYQDMSIYNELDQMETTIDLNSWLAVLMLLLPVGVLVFISSMIVALAGKKK